MIEKLDHTELHLVGDRESTKERRGVKVGVSWMGHFSLARR